MIQKIISNGEIKNILGITGDNQDTQIELWNRQATEMLWDFIGVDSLVSQTVSSERVKIFCSEYWIPRIFPIDLDTITLTDYAGNAINIFTFGQDDQDFRRVNFLDLSGRRTTCGYKEFFASYTAGYTRQQTVEVTDYASLIGNTILAYIDGALTTYTFSEDGAGTNEIAATTSNAQTASNIATALSGGVSSAVVTFPVSTFIELGTATDSMLTVTDYTMPESLKHCVAFLVSGIMAERNKSKNIESYKIGQKEVKFANDTESDFVRATIQKFASKYRDVQVYST